MSECYECNGSGWFTGEDYSREECEACLGTGDDEVPLMRGRLQTLEKIANEIAVKAWAYVDRTDGWHARNCSHDYASLDPKCCCDAVKLREQLRDALSAFSHYSHYNRIPATNETLDK